MSDEELRQKLAADQGIVSWPELERQFARGVLIVVGGEVDLIDAALAVARDETALVGAWMSAGALARATDEHARAWAEAQPCPLRAVVVAPWILVQEARVSLD